MGELQIHRRPADLLELLYLATRARDDGLAHAGRGDVDRAAAAATVGLHLVELIEAGGGDVLLTYDAGPPEVWAMLDAPADARTGLGRAWRCPDTCRCRAIPLRPGALAIGLGVDVAGRTLAHRLSQRASRSALRHTQHVPGLRRAR